MKLLDEEYVERTAVARSSSGLRPLRRQPCELCRHILRIRWNDFRRDQVDIGSLERIYERRGYVCAVPSCRRE